ncbi:MAG: hypothetical protein R3C03_05765 [Pirellulaceae bacterium]
MKGEIVWTTTEDRVRLHGFFADSHGAPQVPIDGAVIVHGLGGNFYSSGLLTFLAKMFVDLGVPVVIANTRGHDFLNLTTRSGRSVIDGSAMEDVDECRFDLPAWTRYLKLNRGCNRVALVGHSLGAIKSIYSEAFAADETVTAIAALSATRLNHELFQHCAASERFMESYRRAQTLVEAGQGSDLAQFEFPFPTWMQAKSYLKKYGPENLFDWNRFIAQVEKPLLMTFGQLETGRASRLRRR